MSFAKAGTLLPWPLKDKSVIQTNPCCFSKLCSTAGVWEQSCWQGREEQLAVFFERKGGNTFFKAASCFVNVWF